MRRRSWIGVPFVVSSAVTIALAQGGAASMPAYDVKSEVAVTGKVTSVAAIPDWMGSRGVNIILQTPEAATVHVDTAPAEFLKMLDFAVANGDNLEVTGVWSVWNGNKVLLARVVTRQKIAVYVRDPEGKPAW